MTRRQSEPVVSPFTGLMAQGLLGYRQDPSYAIAMATTAVTIHAKRATWAARLAVREAEAIARAQCEAVDPVVCTSAPPTPCGVGAACVFSTGELRDLEVPDVPLGSQRGGKLVQRPQPGPDGGHASYNSESAVLVLRYQRAVVLRPT